jgi:hypothetical protein
VRTELRPLDVTVRPGALTVIEVEVGNTADVIDGVTARVEGIDPSWVHLPTPVLSLFPDSTGVLPVHVRFPPTTVVGDYLVVITVESTIDATRRSTHDLWLHVDPVEAASLRLRPSVVTAGSSGRFGAIVANEGNVQIDFTMSALDETRVLDTSVQPLTLTVPPGTEAVAEITVSGKRPWFGQPLARTVQVAADTPTLQLRALATFNQKPRIPRGLLTLLTLAGIIALWSFIFLFGVGLLRGQDDPAKAVAANFNEGGVQDVPLEAIGGAAAGKVTAASTGNGLALITVEAYRITSQGDYEMTASAGTADDGTYALAGLLPGRYKLRYTAAGFDELWYPAGAASAMGEEVEVEPRDEVDALDVAMTGQPGRVSGSIDLPESAVPGAPVTVTIQEVPQPPSDPNAPVPPPPAPIQQVTTDGQIAFDGLRTPGTYRFTIEAEGFAPQQFTQVLDGGADTVLNTVKLGAATGSLSGTVRGSDGLPLGNVEVTVTSGDIEKQATTPTSGNVGTYVIDGLDTPRTYVITFSREGFSGQTIALDLPAGAARTGVDAVLTGGTGTVTGEVTGPDGLPLGGVQVVVSAGDFSAQTATLTTGGAGAGAGSYTVADVPTPGMYTVTFSLDGYQPETRQVGFITPTTVTGVSVQLRRADAAITGTVSGGGRPLAGATVELTDGETTRNTATAATPAGGYVFANVPPGSYTLTVSAPGFQRSIVLLVANPGDTVVRDVTLAAGG